MMLKCNVTAATVSVQSNLSRACSICFFLLCFTSAIVSLHYKQLWVMDLQIFGV